MNPARVSRNKLDALTDLPNIGKAGARHLQALGIHKPGDLVGRCPYEMYESLCASTGIHYDPCVIDVFISVTRFMDGEEPKRWWEYTSERKRHMHQGSMALTYV